MPGPHILVVGGTGMLSGVVEALASDGARLSLLARRAGAYLRAPVAAFDCDYYDEAGFMAALDAAVARSGPVETAVAWFHSTKIPAVRRLAERIGAPGRPGRLFQVLGSAVADPAKPERLAAAAAAAQGLQDCRVRQVVLGFRAETAGSRWLTDAEISGGVLEALREDRRFCIIGTVEPWTSRP